MTSFAGRGGRGWETALAVQQHDSGAVGDARAIDAIAREEQAELERREREYKQGATLTDLRGRIVILVDDGLATGSTMRSAVQAVRQHQPARMSFYQIRAEVTKTLIARKGFNVVAVEADWPDAYCLYLVDLKRTE